jgi:uncharacterized protein (TIGR02996 family)
MTAEENGFLASIEKNPKDATARGAYADWLDEHGRHYDAMLQRAAAGLSEVFFKIRRKSDGRFSEGAEGRHKGNEPWTTRGKLWPTLNHLRAHLTSQIADHNWRRWTAQAPARFLYQGDTPVEDLEVVVVELRFTVGARMSLSLLHDKKDRSRVSIKITEVEPEGAKSGTE